MNKDRGGFTLVEGLVIIFVITVLVVGTYYFWNRPKNTQKSVETAQATQSDRPTVDWLAYGSDEYSFSFKYPPNEELWKGCQITCTGITESIGYNNVTVSKDTTVLYSFLILPEIVEELNEAYVKDNMGSGYGSDLIVETAKVGGKSGFVAVTGKGSPSESKVYYIKNAKGQVLRFGGSIDKDLSSQILATVSIE